MRHWGCQPIEIDRSSPGEHVTRLPRHFAVKILGKPVDSDTSLATLARFRREAEIAAALQHPHIVEVFDYQVSESGSPYLVMELLEGEDLADRLKRGRVPIVAALRIIAEMAEALYINMNAADDEKRADALSRLRARFEERRA